MGGGSIAAKLLPQLAAHANCIVAADGGANALHRYNIAPHVWVGDGDSVRPHTLAYCQQNGALMLPSACQDTTDAQKALHYIAQHRPPTPIVVGVGFGGSRFDHTLGALHVLRQFAPMRIILRLGNDAVMLLPQRTTLHMPVGSRLSLFPLQSVRGVLCRGLRYSIAGLPFALGQQIGISNQTTAASCYIALSKPFAMACIVPWRHWQAFI